MRKFLHKAREYVPIGAMIMIVFTVITLVLHILIVNIQEFADFFNYYLGSPARAFMAYLTGWIPFSLAEALILSIPIWFTVLILLGVRSAKRGKKKMCAYLSFVLCVLLFVLNSFVWTFGSGFHMTPVEEKLGLDREKISAQELYDTAIWIIDNINESSEDVVYDVNGSSVLTDSYDELSDKLYDAYDTVIDKYENLKMNNFRSKLKPIILSEPFTYTHISGVYSFMTGESNINVNYPDYIIASTSAHEFAHQRGIAKEDEASFIAFLVCINSDDSFIRYSGYLDVYQSVMKALKSADKDLYKEAHSRLCSSAKKDLSNYSKMFDKYRYSTASEVSGSINDSYLQANGQKEGTKAYDMVTDLTVAYYKTLNK